MRRHSFLTLRKSNTRHSQDNLGFDIIPKPPIHVPHNNPSGKAPASPATTQIVDYKTARLMIKFGHESAMYHTGERQGTSSAKDEAEVLVGRGVFQHRQPNEACWTGDMHEAREISF